MSIVVLFACGALIFCLFQLMAIISNIRSILIIKKIKIIDAAQNEIATLKQQLAEARAEINCFNELIRQQHRRTIEASKLWQIAHNEPDTWPDLGVLINWLIGRGDGDKSK